VYSSWVASKPGPVGKLSTGETSWRLGGERRKEKMAELQVAEPE